ncbi:hypothetical protein [Nitrosospira sp. Nsp13]|uniref:hypothetical protein n=1 Tax=Nitrosospira sp. Nsp13 TaxID=1855332 RepID=UPI00088EF574|nr:hypothetical protein [Nitrosospira sp. Nsp13]SCX77000.1 hypothetical protein SAMN05216308_10181 [Nitrosospira sp. Nsp13]
MHSITLQQITSNFAKTNAGKTLHHPVLLKYIREFLINSSVLQTLESTCKDGKIYIWGAKFERHHQLNKMDWRQCVFLFRQGAIVNEAGVLIVIEVNEELAHHLWGQDSDGETWGIIFFFKELKSGLSIPARVINRIIGYKDTNHWQGLVTITTAQADEVIQLIKTTRAVAEAEK